MSRQESLSSFVGGANPLKDPYVALDTVILAAYGFSAQKDLLAQLLVLNQKVAAKIEQGESVTASRRAQNYPDAKKLMTAVASVPQIEMHHG